MNGEEGDFSAGVHTRLIKKAGEKKKKRAERGRNEIALKKLFLKRGRFKKKKEGGKRAEKKCFFFGEKLYR